MENSLNIKILDVDDWEFLFDKDQWNQSGLAEVSKIGMSRIYVAVPNRGYFTLLQSEVQPIWDQGSAT